MEQVKTLEVILAIGISIIGYFLRELHAQLKELNLSMIALLKSEAVQDEKIKNIESKINP